MLKPLSRIISNYRRRFVTRMHQFCPPAWGRILATVVGSCKARYLLCALVDVRRTIVVGSATHLNSCAHSHQNSIWEPFYRLIVTRWRFDDFPPGMSLCWCLRPLCCVEQIDCLHWLIERMIRSLQSHGTHCEVPSAARDEQRTRSASTRRLERPADAVPDAGGCRRSAGAECGVEEALLAALAVLSRLMRHVPSTHACLR